MSAADALDPTLGADLEAERPAPVIATTPRAGLFRVHRAEGRRLELVPIDEDAGELLDGLSELRLVEVRRVGVADGSPGSLTAAGRESGWER